MSCFASKEELVFTGTYSFQPTQVILCIPLKKESEYVTAVFLFLGERAGVACLFLTTDKEEFVTSAVKNCIFACDSLENNIITQKMKKNAEASHKALTEL